TWRSIPGRRQNRNWTTRDFTLARTACHVRPPAHWLPLRASGTIRCEMARRRVSRVGQHRIVGATSVWFTELAVKRAAGMEDDEPLPLARSQRFVRRSGGFYCLEDVVGLAIVVRVHEVTSRRPAPSAVRARALATPPSRSRSASSRAPVQQP